MKRLVCFLVSCAIAVFVWCAIALIGEIMITLIACVAIGIWSTRCANWIIDKITDKPCR